MCDVILEVTKRKDGDRMKRLLKVLLILVLLAGVCGSAILIYQGHSNYQQLSKEHPLADRIAEVQDRDDYVSIEEISPYLIDATVSVEDKNFYSHNGVDLAGVARAVLSNLFASVNRAVAARSRSSSAKTYTDCFTIRRSRGRSRKHSSLMNWRATMKKMRSWNCI